MVWSRHPFGTARVTGGRGNVRRGRTAAPAAELLEPRRLFAAEYVSVAAAGGVGATGGDDLSIDASVSADGRYVAFASRASDLVAGFDDDNEGSTDVFLRDRQTGVTTLVSRNNLSATAGANSASGSAQVSADGRFVVFISSATNLNGAAGNQLNQIYLWSRETGQTTLISRGPGGAPGASQSYDPYISGDGRFVVFASLAANLGPGDGNGSNVIFLLDRQSGDLTLESRRDNGSIVRVSDHPTVSDDGRYVTFTSLVSGDVFGAVVVPEDDNEVHDVFVRDRQAETTRLVSRTPAGPSGDAKSDFGRISGDGSVVVFESEAKDLVAGDVNAFNDVFAYDVATRAVTRISSNTGGLAGDAASANPTVSADGRYVAFDSRAEDLLAGGERFTETYVRDRTDGSLVRVGAALNGSTITAGTVDPYLSGDGSLVVFESQATGLDPDTADANGSAQDVFITPRVTPAPAAADLDVTVLGDPAGTYAAGAALPQLSATVANAGAAASGASSVTFALSADATFDAGDTVLATPAFASINGGAQQAVTASAPVPANLAAGSYFLVARVDPASAVAEGDEANNDAATPAAGVVVTAVQGPPPGDAPNLVAESFTLKLKSASVLAGTKAPTARLRLANDGSAPAAGTATIEVLASIDEAPDAADLTVVTLPGVRVNLRPGQGKTYPVKLGTFPGAGSGDYFLVARVVPDGNVTESSAADNATAFAQRVAIAPAFVDLRPGEPRAAVPAALDAGGKLTVAVPLTNDGNVPLKATTESRLVASADLTVDASDAPLATRAVKLTLAAGKTRAARIKFTLDAPLPQPASVFLLLQLDATNVVAESDEANNVAAVVPT